MGPGNLTMLPESPFNGGPSIHMLVYSPNLTYRSSYRETGDNAAFSGPEIAADEFFTMQSLNSSHSPMQENVYIPGNVWMG